MGKALWMISRILHISSKSWKHATPACHSQSIPSMGLVCIFTCMNGGFLWLMWDTLHPYHPLWWNSPSHERMMETQGNALTILSRNFMHKKLLPKNRADGQNTCRCQHGWTPIQNTIKTHVKTCPSIRRICREVTCALSSGLCPRIWFLPRQGSKWTNFRTHRIQVWYSRSLQLV